MEKPHELNPSNETVDESLKKESGIEQIEIINWKQKQIESKLNKRISLNEGFQMIGMDLNRSLDETMRMYKLQGLLDDLVHFGIVRNYDDLGRIFDKVTLSEIDMKTAKAEYIDQNIPLIPIFDPLGQNSVELINQRIPRGESTNYHLNFNVDAKNPRIITEMIYWFKLIYKIGIPCARQDYYWSLNDALYDLKSIKYIDPTDIYDLPNIWQYSSEKQIDVFQKAYESAKEQSPSGPRVIFTPDTIGCGNRKGLLNTSALELMASGIEKILDLGANILRFNVQAMRIIRTIAENNGVDFNNFDQYSLKKFLTTCFKDETIHKLMPDSEQYGICCIPHCVYPDGKIPGITYASSAKEPYFHVGKDTIENKMALYLAIGGSRLALG